MKKLMIIGLDCGAPYIVFEKYLEKLPNFKELLNKSCWGKMRSTDPPITVPAWMCMMTSKSPGHLGIYGFRNRKGYSYDLEITTSLKIKKAKKLWDILGDNGYISGVLSVPPSYPPYKVNGFLTSCFLTPQNAENYTYPPELKNEIEENTGEYIFDARGFRTDDKERLIKDIYKLTENKFKTVNYLIDNKKWDMFMFVEMGVDRIHHGFWRFFDEKHPNYEPGNKFENEILSYYQLIDKRIGELLSKLDEETNVMIVSDHGAQALNGGICLNEWFIKEGYLKLKKYPSEITRMDRLEVDWENTTAWGEGGYYGRVFINVKNREREGKVEDEDFEKVRDELIERLTNLPDEKGNKLNTKVFRPRDLYNEVKGFPPDLIVYFDDLNMRSIGSVGHNTVWTSENDTGPDDANHSIYGMYIYYDPSKKVSINKDISIYDITPTVLRDFNIDIPGGLMGKPVENG